jgi:hypothetical protein
MRAATASAREPRGERTLMGIGPEFIRREAVADGVSGTLDGVPQERMDRTPSAPIVVESRAVVPSPTVRIPLPVPERTVQLSVAPNATAELPVEPPLPAGAPSPRLDSLVSARFFQEGEKQEANGWEDSPLTTEPFPDEEPPKISSFDRVPRRRGPLLVTTFLLGAALVAGLAAEGADAGAARAWLAKEAGPRAVQAWQRAKSGLAMRLTPESTNASARALAAPAQPAPATVPAESGAPAPVASTPSSATVAPPAEGTSGAPLVAAPAAPRVPGKLITSRPKPGEIWHGAVAATLPPKSDPMPRGLDRASADEPRTLARQSGSAAPTAPGEENTAGAAPSTEPTPTALETRVEPRHGLVWSPDRQGLVPAEPASAELPTNDPAPRPAGVGNAATSRGPDDRAATSRGTDKDVLPLDEQAHATY